MSVSPGTGNWEEFLLLLRHLIQICSSASHTSLQMSAGEGGLTAWQSVQLPSSHCIAPPQLLLYTSNFGFVISNWSNPLNGFPGYQSSCQKDRGRENVRRNTRKSLSLKIKLFFLTEKHLLHNFPHHHYFSNSPGVVGFKIRPRGRSSFPLSVQVQSSVHYISTDLHFQQHGCYGWRSSLGTIMITPGCQM